MNYPPRTPWPSLALLITACFAATGCHTKGAGDPTPPPGFDQAWAPAPASIRVFPSTRVVRERGAPVLETRVELRDAMGDPVKASGQFLFELYARPGGRLTLGPLLHRWEEQLVDATHQRRFFDPVTLAYRFQLVLDDPAVAERRTRLSVAYTRPDGQRFDARLDLPVER